MRRFFIGSALAALIGLLLAGAAYWAYWQFHARFQPVLISRNQAQVQQLLDEASWVSDGSGGQPLYVVSYRDSGSAQRFEREEAPRLRTAGVEVRYIVFARADREGLAQSTAAERATVAELWLSRDWTLHQRWMATPSRSWTAAGVPQADGNLARSAVVEASRQFVDELSALLKPSGVQTSYPLVLWRDRQGFLKACGCVDSRSWPPIRDDLNIRGRADQTPPISEIPAPAVVVPNPITPLSPTAPVEDHALPYPKLAPAPPVVAPSETPAPYPLPRSEPLPAPFRDEPPAAAPQPRPAPAQPRPQVQPSQPQASQAQPPPSRQRAPATSRNAPQARKQDDTTFY